MLNIATWRGDAAPPFEPRLPAPLPGQRAGGGRRRPNPVAGALMTERRTVMVAARVSPPEHAAWRNKAAAGHGAHTDVDRPGGRG